MLHFICILFLLCILFHTVFCFILYFYFGFRTVASANSFLSFLPFQCSITLYFILTQCQYSYHTHQNLGFGVVAYLVICLQRCWCNLLSVVNCLVQKSHWTVGVFRWHWSYISTGERTSYGSWTTEVFGPALFGWQRSLHIGNWQCTQSISECHTGAVCTKVCFRETKERSYSWWFQQATNQNSCDDGDTFSCHWSGDAEEQNLE